MANNGLIITDASNKIDKIPDSVLAQFGYTREGLIRKQQQENAAILMCGGLLGDCYLMAEVIDWMLTPNGKDIFNKIKKQKWYKQEVKTHINQAFEELRQNISICKENSPTDRNYMESMADSLYDELQIEITKLTNAFILEIGNKIKDSSVLASFLVIDVLAQWISNYYDSTIEHMKTEVFADADYNSWYYQARFSGVSFNLGKAIEWYGKKFSSTDIDFNKSTIIKAGVTAIDRIMNDPKVAEKLKKDNSILEEGGGEELYNESLELLGITSKQKNLPKPKQKKEKPIVSIEEQIEVEMTAKDILSQKYRVK